MTSYFKRLYESTAQMLLHPATAWDGIRNTATAGNMFSEFLYPMIMLCGTAKMIGIVLSNGISFGTLYGSLADAAMYTFSLLIAFYLAVPAVRFIAEKVLRTTIGQGAAYILTGYSMTAILALEICSGIFPAIRPVALTAQLYTLRIVWHAATTLFDAGKELRIAYTFAVTITLIALPVVIGKALGMLS